MNYYLSSSDVSVLKNTINTVNNLTGATPKNQKPVIKNAFAYAELIEEDTNGLWSAKEVYFDETGTPNELTDGRTWGGDNPSVIINGTVSAGQVVRIEAYYLVDSSDEEQAVWVGSAIGGGDSYYRLRCNSDTTIGRDTSNTFFDLVDELNNIITPNVAVTQSRFNSAFFYVDEVIYAIDSDVATYSVDPFIFGVGG
jgi:hypothetical protein